ncbi:MAG TPA: hypothetical protein VFN74_19630, partial [Chloroflexota bacterium]|nr:hypothetical protein [Chloroflexota bacterium]
PMSARPWTPPADATWLWLRAGAEGRAPLHEPLLGVVDEQGGTSGGQAWPNSASVLPLAASVSPPPAVANGSLVKGSGDDIFLVERGHVRWVSSLRVLERLGASAVQQLEDRLLWRLPVGLPVE